jgi:uncharacterized membrane protein (DUF485 family)
LVVGLRPKNPESIYNVGIVLLAAADINTSATLKHRCIGGYFMFKHKRLRYITIFMLLILSFTFAAPTFACYNSPTLEETIDGSRYVFIGTIVATFVDEDNYSLTAQIEVERYLQGEGQAVVYLTDFYYYLSGPRHGGCDTDIEIAEGQSWVFFGNGDGQTLQTYRAGRNYDKVYLDFDDLPDRVVLGYINDPFRPVHRLVHQLQWWKYAKPFYNLQWAIEDRVRSFKPSTIVMYSLMLVGVLVLNFVARRWRTYNRPIASKRGNTDKG